MLSTWIAFVCGIVLVGSDDVPRNRGDAACVDEQEKRDRFIDLKR